MVEAKQTEWTGKSRGGGFGHAFFVFLIRHCGIRSAYLFLALVCCYFIPFAPRATAAVWDYYRRRHRYGRLRAAAALYRHYYRFGQTLIDRVAIRAGMGDRYDFRFDNYDAFMELLRRGSGVVMIGAHVGCWEAGSRFFSQYEGRLNVVMYDAEWARIREAVERHADMRNYRIIPVNGPSLDAVLKIKVALNGGEPVCFQGDRFLSDEHTLTARFMGAEARFPEGPFLLAVNCKRLWFFILLFAKPVVGIASFSRSSTPTSIRRARSCSTVMSARWKACLTIIPNNGITSISSGHDLRTASHIACVGQSPSGTLSGLSVGDFLSEKLSSPASA